MKRFLILGIALLLPIMYTAGCGGPVKPDGLPELVKKTVRVTQDGQPVAGVHLTLYLTGAGKNWPVFGDSDAEGNVMFCTQTVDFKGAPAGEYSVTAEKVEATPSKYDNVEVADFFEAQALAAKRAAEYRPSYDLVDPLLKQKDTTTLTLSITKDGCTPDTLDLGPACREMFIPAGSASEPGLEPEDVEIDTDD